MFGLELRVATPALLRKDQPVRMMGDGEGGGQLKEELDVT